MEQVGEQETDELEGHGDHAVPNEGDDGANGHAFDVNVVGSAEAGSEDGGFPVWGSGVCGCLFVGLLHVNKCVSTLGGQGNTYRWQLLLLSAIISFRLGCQVRKDTLILDTTTVDPS